MSQTNTSNTRDSEINNVGRDQVSLLSTRDTTTITIYQSNYYFYSSPAAVTASQSVNGSSAGTRDRGSEETQARAEDGGVVFTGAGSLMRKLWLILVCLLLICSI
ncbi:hypothetical protein FIBSPDRAFT_874065, partial [Athelia psychrophila]